MIDESCRVPRENLDDGFNPCRRQVMENGELCQYAHMYDVMNERYDREGETSYLDSVKRDRISQSTPSQSTGGGKIYSQDTNGVEGFISTSGTLEPTSNAEIPSSKAVADYAQPKAKVKDGLGTVSGCNASGDALDRVMVSNMDMSTASDGSPTIPSTGAVNIALATKQDKLTLPLSIEQGGTGGNTPYITDDLDNSGIFVMHDAPNDRYGAAPMSALTGYLDTRYIPVESKSIPSGSDLNEYKTSGNYAVLDGTVVPSIINKPVNLTEAFNVYVFPVLLHDYYIGQQISTYKGTATYYRYYNSGSNQWSEWTLLYPTSAPDTPPSKFYYAVSPFPSDTWEGEMTVNVTPVFSVKIGAYTYVLARVYAYKRFIYTGSADNINLFTSLKPVGDYTGVFSNSTPIPLTFNVFGRSNTDGAYGLTPKGSAANLSLNLQTVSSVFDLGNFNVSSNLKCVFGEGSNTPGVAVSVDCMALMWHSVS